MSRNQLINGEVVPLTPEEEAAADAMEAEWEEAAPERDQAEFDEETVGLVNAEIATLTASDSKKYIRNGLSAAVAQAHQDRAMEMAESMFDDAGPQDGIKSGTKAAILAIYNRAESQQSRKGKK